MLGTDAGQESSGENPAAPTCISATSTCPVHAASARRRPEQLQFAEAHVARVRTLAPARARHLNLLQQRELEQLRDACTLSDPPGVALAGARFLATAEVRRSSDLGEVES